MEKFETFVNEANNNFQTADHLLYVTYSLLKDTKLMFSIVNNLHNATINAIAALIYYEKVYKRVNAFPLDIESRIKMFETELSKNYTINQDVIKTIRELRFIIKQHIESPMEFTRKEKLIICNNDYSKMSVVDITKLKYYATNVRGLINIVNKLKNVRA